MTLSDIAPPAPTINYPAIPRSRAILGVMNQTIDTGHADLIAAVGATVTRLQFGWSDVQDPVTGAFSLTTAQASYLAYLGSLGIRPILVAAFGPPYQTIGTLTVTGTVPAGSPQGTDIPVAPYAFGPIATNSTDFAGGLFEGYPAGLTSRTAYYGDIIQAADADSIQVGSALAVQLNPGSTLKIQRLRYAPPFTATDPSIAAYVAYVQFLAAQIIANGCTGWVDIWNEYPWAHDRWSEPGGVNGFYDVTPPSYTLPGRMKSILQALQAATLPVGVQLVNGVSDKSGSNGIAAQGVTGTNFYADSVHPYGNTPEGHCVSPFGWGGSIGQFPGSTAHWDAAHAGSGWDGWDAIIPSDEGGSFRGMLFSNRFKPGGPYAPEVIVTESGLATANDLTHARYYSRMVLANWGNGYPIVDVFELDDGQDPGSNSEAIAPSGTPRQSYFALQRIMAIIARMDAATANTAVPVVVGWPSTANPLMSTTIAGDQPGNYVLFVWQRTWADPEAWTAIDSPTARPVSIFLPPGLVVAEASDVVSAASVTPTTVNSTLLTVPVADDPVAIRFAPA